MKNQISKQLAYLTFTLTLIITIVAIFIPKIVDAAPNYKWGDKNHDSLTGPTGTKYSSLGYACLIIFKNDGTLDESRGAYPESSDKDIQVSYSNEAFSGVSTVPSCKDGNPANYVWISSDKRSAVVVGGNQDNKLVGIGSPYKGEARLWQIGPNGVPEKPVDIAKIDKPNDNSPPETDQTKKGVETEQASTGGDKSTEDQCSQALSPFGWILCPATNFADNLYSLFKQLVNNLLFFESDKYNDNGLYDSWKIMVTLANTVLVLVAIVMIAAQIFNFEFISAYTVKKALPRIVVAAILIQLSWFMVTTGVQLVNAIGSGIYWLLVAPFTRNIDAGDSGGVLEIGPILAQGGANGSEVANAGMFVFASGALATGALLAFASGLWMTMVVAAIGVVISILVAIVTLILREALLIVLIALAPLAIAFWILPGTNGLWNMWWKTFSRLLLMYPLIMLLFAGGTISAILLASAGDNINKIFAIVAYFIPVFLISTTYKFAGGAFASMANFTSKMGDKAKGSSLFGMRDTAKRKREESPLSLARAARKEQHRIDAQKKFADRLGSDSLYGKGLRRASGGGNANTIVARAQQQQIKEKSEDIDRIVSGDTSRLRDIVNNSAQGDDGVFNNDSYARIAAFQQLAKMGKTEEGDFRAIGKMLSGDEVLRNKVVGDAAFASGQAGNLTMGKILSVSGEGAITYKDKIPDSASATSDAVRNMTQEQYKTLVTETVGGQDRFKDTNVRDYFNTQEGAQFAQAMLRDPDSSRNLTITQKAILEQHVTQAGLNQPTQQIGPVNIPGNPQGPTSPWTPPGPQQPPSGPSTPP